MKTSDMTLLVIGIAFLMLTMFLVITSQRPIEEKAALMEQVISVKDLSLGVYKVIKVDYLGESKLQHYKGFQEIITTVQDSNGKKITVRTYEADPNAMPRLNQMWKVWRDNEGTLRMERWIPKEPSSPSTASSRKEMAVLNFNARYYMLKSIQ